MSVWTSGALPAVYLPPLLLFPEEPFARASARLPNYF